MTATDPADAVAALDHIALTVPNLDDQIERLTRAFGMVVRLRTEHFAVIVDSRSDFKFELSASEDGEVHVRHLGFRADDVDATRAWSPQEWRPERRRIDRISRRCTRPFSRSPEAWKFSS
jgi:catechol 2,3-dioxygenase-like lactoylglutathione lyase family enzyme